MRDDLLIGCLFVERGLLHACSWAAPDMFALGASNDGGESFEVLAEFAEADAPLRCEAAPEVETLCSGEWSDWSLEVLMPFEPEAPAEAPAGSGSSGCQLGSGSTTPSPALLGVLLLTLAARRRRRPGTG